MALDRVNFNSFFNNVWVLGHHHMAREPVNNAKTNPIASMRYDFDITGTHVYVGIQTMCPFPNIDSKARHIGLQ
jgi:hypothetical protein